MTLNFMVPQEKPKPDKQAFIQSIVDNGEAIVGKTPCHITQLTEHLVLVGAAKTETEAFTRFLDLADEHPSSIVIEKEGSIGYYLSFIDVQAFRDAFEANDATEKPNTDPAIEYFSQMLNKSQPTKMEGLCSRILAAVVSETRMERAARLDWKSQTPAPALTKICDSDSYSFCSSHRTRSTSTRPCCTNEIHLERVVAPHTDTSLGDCSYLDTCFKGKQCKFVHYRIKYPSAPQHLIELGKFSPSSSVPPQFINANLLTFDLSALGSDYQALIVDPPWSIHTNPNFEGGCSDSDFSKLRIDLLQTDGVIFLWVTGRVLDLGRKCLKDWGYDHIEELIWLKTNQLGRTICTGRTGHWLNHTKEHVLVGCKGNFRQSLKSGFDSDVIVSNALGKSQKPDELYGIIDRLVGASAQKLELFGRKSNIRPGWLTIGNELERTELNDLELKRRVQAALR